MRTTIDLSPDAMAVARSQASTDGVTLGQAISDLIVRATRQPTPAPTGFPLFTPADGHLITDELVAEHRDAT